LEIGNSLRAQSNPAEIAGIKIAVFGLGYVGTSIAAAWLRAGAAVDGFDLSVERIASLRTPKSIDFEKAVEEAFEQGLASGKLGLYSISEGVKTEANVKFVCVPVYLLSEERRADLSFLKSAAGSIALTLRKGDAVVICPSVPPGTTRNEVVPILEKSSGLSAGEDFDVIYSPERILVGRAVEDIEKRYPAIISGINEKSLARAESLFLRVAQKGVVKMPNLETAEFEKLAEGVYRDVNIALANELAMVCDELGVNFWAVREAANSQPFCNLHVPGLGVGGACIPVYPWFATQSLKKSASRIIEDSREINDSMVDYLVTSLETNFAIGPGSEVAILGLAFRGGVADSRMSVTYRLVEHLREKGITHLQVHDPLIRSDATLGTILNDNLEKALAEADVAIIATDHRSYGDFPWDSIPRKKPKLRVIDCKGMLLGKKFSKVEIFGLGYGGDRNPRIFEATN
jgi:nucleotide sugar dehydrogenase